MGQSRKKAMQRAGRWRQKIPPTGFEGKGRRQKLSNTLGLQVLEPLRETPKGTALTTCLVTVPKDSFRTSGPQNCKREHLHGWKSLNRGDW